MRQGRDLYRKHRRLVRRGPRRLRVSSVEEMLAGKTAETKLFARGEDVSREFPVTALGPLVRSYLSGRPAFVTMFRMNAAGHAFAEIRGSRGNYHGAVVRRLDLVLVEGKA